MPEAVEPALGAGAGGPPKLKFPCMDGWVGGGPQLCRFIATGAARLDMARGGPPGIGGAPKAIDRSAMAAPGRAAPPLPPFVGAAKAIDRAGGAIGGGGAMAGIAGTTDRRLSFFSIAFAWSGAAMAGEGAMAGFGGGGGGGAIAGTAEAIDRAAVARGGEAIGSHGGGGGGGAMDLDIEAK